MERRNGLRQRITQRFRVAPVLSTAVTGMALAAIVCVVIFLWGNFGSSKKAIANKSAATIVSSAIPSLSSNNAALDTSDIAVSGNPKLVTPLIPPGILINNITYSGANLKWKAASGSAYYMVRVSVAGKNQWTYISVKSRQKKLDNLIENTYYDFQVQAYSKTDSSGWSAVQTFKTGHMCDIPENLSIGTVTSTSAMLHWTGDPNILQYSIRYREQGQTDWSDESVFNNNHSNRFLLTTLKPGASYEWQIRCQCPYGEDNWSDYQPGAFNTLDAAETTTNDAGNPPVIINQIKVSPNPNTGQFLVELNFGKAEVKTARMELSNLSGQVLLKENLNIENNLLSESINIGSNFPQGFYLLKVSAGGNVYQTQISLNKD